MHITDIMEILITTTTIFRLTIGFLFVLFGYKWHKGLISTTAFQIGVIGTIVIEIFMYLDLESAFGLSFAIVAPISIGLLLAFFSYKNLAFNKFMIGYIVGIKTMFMLLTFTLSPNILNSIQIEMFIIIPIIAGIVFGIVLAASRLKYIGLIIFTAYIGSVEIGPELAKIINKGLFVLTGEFHYLFDLKGFILSLLGIDFANPLTIAIIIVIFVIGLAIQKYQLSNNGIKGNYIVDDSNFS